MKLLVFLVSILTLSISFAQDSDLLSMSFNADDSVLTSNGDEAVVVEALKDGRVKVKFPAYNNREGYFSANFLAVTNVCLVDDKVCVGDGVMNRSGEVAFVKGIFNDDTLAIEFKNGQFRRWPIKDLAYASRCTEDEFCAKDRVAYGNDSATVVAAFIRSNAVMIKFDSVRGYRFYKTSTLSKIEK